MRIQVAIAIAAADGFILDVEDIPVIADPPPRIAHYLRLADAAIAAYEGQ